LFYQSSQLLSFRAVSKILHLFLVLFCEPAFIVLVKDCRDKLKKKDKNKKEKKDKKSNKKSGAKPLLISSHSNAMMLCGLGIKSRRHYIVLLSARLDEDVITGVLTLICPIQL